MKICGKCNQEKTNFNKRAKSKDGLSSWCKDCYKKYDKDRYTKGDAGRKKVNWQRRVDKNRLFVKNYLQTHACIDCGENEWWALEFDHKEARTKQKPLTRIIMENGLDRVKEEITRCDVRCVKCHRKRTIFQMNWWHKDFLVI